MELLNPFVEPDALAPLVAELYSLPVPIKCSLIRRGFNDNYLIVAGGARYVLRLYLNGKYYIGDAGDFRFELDLLDHLVRAGLPVVPPLRSVEGVSLIELSAGGTRRPAALFPYVSGDPLPKPPPPAMAPIFGDMLARMHDAMDTFQSTHHRYRLDASYLIDEPLRMVEEHVLANAPEVAAVLRERAADWREQLARLPSALPGFGLIHADLNFSNVLYDGDRLTLIDFDHAAYGWRIYELAMFEEPLADGWEPFLSAYRARRPVTQIELDARPLMRTLLQLWDVGDVLAIIPAWGRRPSDRFFERAAVTARRLAATGPSAPASP